MNDGVVYFQDTIILKGHYHIENIWMILLHIHIGVHVGIDIVIVVIIVVVVVIVDDDVEIDGEDGVDKSDEEGEEAEDASLLSTMQGVHLDLLHAAIKLHLLLYDGILLRLQESIPLHVEGRGDRNHHRLNGGRRRRYCASTAWIVVDNCARGEEWALADDKTFHFGRGE